MFFQNLRLLEINITKNLTVDLFFQKFYQGAAFFIWIIITILDNIAPHFQGYTISIITSKLIVSTLKKILTTNCEIAIDNKQKHEITKLIGKSLIDLIGH